MNDMAMTVAIAAGWILAAFLGGFLLGRKRDALPEKRPQKADRAQKNAIPDAQTDQLKRELLNFLNYDGTAQEPE